jgi:hypothetical protein
METALLFAARFCLSSSAQQRPVLYPKDHLEATGQAAIDECMRLAKKYVADEDEGDRVAKGATKGAVVVAAVGAAEG